MSHTAVPRPSASAEPSALDAALETLPKLVLDNAQHMPGRPAIREKDSWAMLASQALRGVPVSLYQGSIEREMQYGVGHAEARFAVVEDQEQVDKAARAPHGVRGLHLRR